MEERNKQGLLEISSMAVKIILCTLLVFNSLLFLYYGVIHRANPLEKESLQFIESWTVKDGEGNEFTTGRSYEAEKAYQKEVTITTTLPLDIKDREYLFFDMGTDVAVYIDGQLRKDFVEKRDVSLPGGTVKRFHVMVPLNASDAGTEVKMMISPGKNSDQIVPETFISTRYGAFSYLMRREGLSFFLAAIVLMFSLVAFIVSLVLRYWYRMKLDMTYGSLGIFVIACWILTDSSLFPYIFGMEYINGTINYMLCFMIPFAPAIYLNSVQRGRYRIGMSIVMMISCINAVVWPLLHFTGIWPFYRMRTIGNLILVSMAVLAITILLYDAFQGRISRYRYTFIGFFGFLICCVVELLLILFSDTNEAIPMVVGLGFLLAFIVIQQVDDLRKINQEKQHAIAISEAKTRFLASMSHEIRTPINAILGMNEMILRENQDGVIEEYSRNIKSSGKMLLMLVNDVLDFSKIEAGKLEINEARFLLSDVLRDVLSMVKERADEKQLELKTEITDAIPNELISDEFRIRQILINYINNAVKYTDKGTITLRLAGSETAEGFELCLFVKDTGKGIRKEDQATLFEAFSRVDLKANANIEGTGLGLAIVKSIVTSMNGTLGVESEFGVGSEFWVKLPVKYVSKDPLKSDFMEARTEQKGAVEDCEFMAPDAKVLAVDDNQSNLTIVKLFLKRTRIQLDLCSTGTHAMELCREKTYDLILLDHMMPSPDGLETLRGIRTDETSRNQNTKAVVLTANAVAGSRQTYLDAGFDEYLTKPLDAKLLEQTVKDLLPKEKVILGKEAQAPGKETAREEVISKPNASLKERLTAVDGLDYDTALSYCAGDVDFLEEIVSDIAKECPERSERMRKSLVERDWKAYAIDAHTLKSSMATIGLKPFSERAKKHEFAAKEMDTEFLLKDADEFLQEYVAISQKLAGKDENV
ncbi:MAG: response regulator [Lachnospiraceae bacterium]|jgi:signal transduction histidine kinase/CheY-like chemotaxis protein/HPt (histidine-containing phosphotransfer) domain-containing protein|nr:response regulator [Lachnospiraceae bacterium]